MNMLLALVLLLFVPSVHADGLPPVTFTRNVQVTRFYGFAYALGSHRYLYTTVNERRYAGARWLGGTVIYYSPDGQRLASEVLEFSKGPFIPLYRLDMPRVQYAAGVNRITESNVYLFRKRGTETNPRYKKIHRSNDLVIGAGLENFIASHFSALADHKHMRIRLVSSGRMKAFVYTISRLRDGVCEGKKVVRFKIDRNSMLHFLAGRPMIFDVIPASRRVCQYRGVSELLDPKTGQPYHVRIDYARIPPPGAPRHLPPL